MRPHNVTTSGEKEQNRNNLFNRYFCFVVCRDIFKLYTHLRTYVCLCVSVFKIKWAHLLYEISNFW